MTNEIRQEARVQGKRRMSVEKQAANRSESEPALVVGARTDPNEQESVVLTPELEGFVPDR